MRPRDRAWEAGGRAFEVKGGEGSRFFMSCKMERAGASLPSFENDFPYRVTFFDLRVRFPEIGGIDGLQHIIRRRYQLTLVHHL